MSEENQEIEEIVEVEADVEVIEKKKVPKGAIVAAVTAAGVGIACGVKWLIGKLRASRLDYVEIEDDYEVDIEEDDLEEETQKE